MNPVGSNYKQKSSMFDSPRPSSNPYNSNSKKCPILSSIIILLLSAGSTSAKPISTAVTTNNGDSTTTYKQALDTAYTVIGYCRLHKIYAGGSEDKLEDCIQNTLQSETDHSVRQCFLYLVFDNYTSQQQSKIYQCIEEVHTIMDQM